MIYWGIAGEQAQYALETAALLERRTKDAPWSIVAFETENWNRDFSPWPAPSVMGQEPMSGGAGKTLNWLTEACIPEIEKGMDASLRLIGGYSLSGLFSLLAFYESGLFRGAASCSGSLWYPGWKEYAQRESAPKDSCVYLSLGTKEEKTRKSRMAAVGDMTRWQHAQICLDANICVCELVWHPGGHFTEVPRRMALGFAWMIEHARSPEETQNGHERGHKR